MIVLAFCAQNSATAKLYKYTDLHLKDYEQMSKLVNQHLDAAQKIIDETTSKTDEIDKGTLSRDDEADQKAIEELCQALQLIFSRPNRDNMVEKLIPDIRRQLKNFNSFEDTLETLLGEALQGVKSKNLSIVIRSTYLFLIENLMEEIQPQLTDNKRFYGFYVRIREADLEVPKEIIKDRRKRMYKRFNPSAIAKQVLKRIDEKKK